MAVLLLFLLASFSPLPFGAACVQIGRDHAAGLLTARVAPFHVGQIGFEHGRQRMNVGEMKLAERRDHRRDVDWGEERQAAKDSADAGRARG